MEPYPTKEGEEMYVKFFMCRKNSLTQTLHQLRRRVTNGLMSGIIQLFFKQKKANGTFGHAINFLVDDTFQRDVYYIDIMNKQVVKNDINNLVDIDFYQDMIYYLPSFECDKDLEAIDKVSKALKSELRKIKKEKKRKSSVPISSTVSSSRKVVIPDKRQKIDFAGIENMTKESTADLVVEKTMTIDEQLDAQLAQAEKTNTVVDLT